MDFAYARDSVVERQHTRQRRSRAGHFEIDFVATRVVQSDAKPNPTLHHRLMRHHGERRHSNEWKIKRDAQRSHEGETDALAREGARSGRDGQPVKTREIQRGVLHGRFDHRRAA
jgi:hypothetical protein